MMFHSCVNFLTRFHFHPASCGANKQLYCPGVFPDYTFISRLKSTSVELTGPSFSLFSCTWQNSRYRPSPFWADILRTEIPINPFYTQLCGLPHLLQETHSLRCTMESGSCPSTHLSTHSGSLNLQQDALNIPSSAKIISYLLERKWPHSLPLKGKEACTT